jgi:hypothetical protein
MDDHQPLEQGKPRRSFRVVTTLDMKYNDQTSRLSETRLEIDANKGRVVQAGSRAGSSLFRLLKADPRQPATLPYACSVLLQEMTRSSKHKQFAYSVSLLALPENRRPEGMKFQGSYRTTATKLTLEEFDALLSTSQAARLATNVKDTKTRRIALTKRIQMSTPTA